MCFNIIATVNVKVPLKILFYLSLYGFGVDMPEDGLSIRRYM